MEDDNDLTEMDDQDVPLVNPAAERIYWSAIPVIAPIASIISSIIGVISPSRKKEKDEKELDSKKED